MRIPWLSRNDAKGASSTATTGRGQQAAGVESAQAPRPFNPSATVFDPKPTQGAQGGYSAAGAKGLLEASDARAHNQLVNEELLTKLAARELDPGERVAISQLSALGFLHDEAFDQISTNSNFWALRDVDLTFSASTAFSAASQSE